MSLPKLSAFAILVVAVSITAAQDDAGKPDTDPSGTWKWEREFNGNKIDYTLRLTQKGDKVTGTYQTVFESGGRGLPEPVNIDDGRVDGDKITFTVTRSFNDNEFTVSYTGNVADDTITGTTTLDFGNGPREVEWNARRTVILDDIAGFWKIKFETPNGEIESEFDIEKKDDKWQGTYHSSFFGDHPIQDIELKDKAISFAVTFERDNREFNVTYKAEPRGDSLTGVIVANFGGQENETPFEGSRTAGPKSDDARGDAAEDNGASAGDESGE